MIRIIVGTLLEVGRKKYSPDKMINIINQKNRQYAGPTVPSHGLYFLKIEY